MSTLSDTKSGALLSQALCEDLKSSLSKLPAKQLLAIRFVREQAHSTAASTRIRSRTSHSNLLKRSSPLSQTCFAAEVPEAGSLCDVHSGKRTLQASVMSRSPSQDWPIRQSQNPPSPPQPPTPPIPQAPSVVLSGEQFQQLSTHLSRAAALQQQLTVSQEASRQRFLPQDLGFFDPDNEAPAVETVGGETVYHSVFSFLTRVRVKTLGITGEWSPQNVAARLDLCLRGRAETWYTNELSAVTRAGLRSGIEFWCQELEKRFRESPATALAKLENLRYTITDARNRRDPADYFQEIIVRGQNAGTAATEYAQMLTARNHIESGLRQNIPLPTTATTLSEFMASLSAAREIWFDLYYPGQQLPQ